MMGIGKMGWKCTNSWIALYGDRESIKRNRNPKNTHRFFSSSPNLLSLYDINEIIKLNINCRINITLRQKCDKICLSSLGWNEHVFRIEINFWFVDCFLWIATDAPNRECNSLISFQSLDVVLSCVGPLCKTVAKVSCTKR